MGFPRQEYWSGLPFSSPEDLFRDYVSLFCLVLFLWGCLALSFETYFFVPSLCPFCVLISVYSIVQLHLPFLKGWVYVEGSLWGSGEQSPMVTRARYSRSVLCVGCVLLLLSLSCNCFGCTSVWGLFPVQPAVRPGHNLPAHLYSEKVSRDRAPQVHALKLINKFPSCVTQALF